MGFVEELEGVLERIVYEAEETGYTVARFRAPRSQEAFTAVGNLLACAPGEHLKLKGRWTDHPKYGCQFQVEDFERTTPATVEGIQRYLSSGLIRGIGPSIAQRITDHFGLETLKVIDEEPERLTEVEGIGEVRSRQILKAWEEQREIREVMLFLKTHNVSTASAAKIYKTYGRQAIRVLKENPYRLAEDVYGIGFVTADRIATDLGMPKDAHGRLQAALLHTLGEAADREGHIYLPRPELIARCARLLEASDRGSDEGPSWDQGESRARIEAALDQAEAAGKVAVEHLREGEPAAYLAPFHAAERSLARNLKRLLATPGPVPARALEKAERLIDRVQREQEVPYTEQQLKAMRTALSHKMLVLTGGPGTGKTTTVRGIIHLLEELELAVYLAAPTGRAAKRLSEAAGRPAKTVHRLLEYSPKGGFGRDERRPLELDALVVDELSMVDLVLMHHLVKALPPRAALILVGDADQLPAVGAGDILHDLIASRAAEVIELTEIFRQARQSMIVTNAHRVNRGEFPEIGPRRNGDFFFLEAEDPEDAARTVEALVTQRLPDHYGFDPVEEIQVLSPMYRGAAGVEALNRSLQERLNPRTRGSSVLRSGGREFRVGDKVMQIRNDYEKETFNGDIGRVVVVDPIEQRLIVRFPGRGAVIYEPADLSNLVTAYAITVHKSQGSEYRAVVLPWLLEHYIMLRRNLLYTAVTRAQELVVIVGAKKALGIAIRNDQQAQRYSGLAARLVAA